MPDRSSLGHRLRTAAALPRAELVLTVRAMLWMVAVRALLPLAGFARVHGLVRRARVRPARRDVHAGTVSRAVERAARSVSGSTCLPQALVAARLLRVAGLPAELTIGVARPTAPVPVARTGAPVPLDAHAWTRSGDLVVAGDTDLERFTELATFVVAP